MTETTTGHNRLACTVPATERLARAALELHRLALAADEIRHLPSPLTPKEKNTKGAADPTADAALDPRRVRVDDEARHVGREAVHATDVLEPLARSLRDALNNWDGR